MVELHERVSASTSMLGRGRQSLRQWCVAHDLTAEETEDVVLATSEALANAIEHGAASSDWPFVDLRAEREPFEVLITVVDRGSWRPPPAVTDRGRGLSIIRALMDELTISSGESGTTVVMRKRVVAPANEAPAPFPAQDGAADGPA